MSRSPPCPGVSGALGILIPLLLASLLVVAAPRPPVDGPRGPSRASSPPSTLVLQPDAANGTDAFVLDAMPLRNYGSDPILWVGPDPGNGSRARALLRFDLAAVPGNATVLDATLELYASTSAPGSTEVHRATAPWLEGAGGGGWTRIPATVRETAGVRRTLEPVEVVLAFAPGAIEDPVRDVRVYAGAAEVPSQVGGFAYSGGQVVGAHVWFGATVPAWGTRTYDIVYSANGTSVPAYRLRGFVASPMWVSPPVGTGASSVTLADLDGDGDLEVIYGTQTGSVVARTADGGPFWSTPLATRSVPYAPQVADMDRDGRLDLVVFTNGPSLHRLDDQGRVLWNVAMGVAELPLSTPTLVDVNGDGTLDVLLGGRASEVRAYDGRTGAQIRAYPAGDWTYTSSVADADGDGRPELYFASDDRLVHAYDVNGTQRWANATAGTGFIENSVAVGDVNGDGTHDIVAGDDGNTGPVFALDALTGRVHWSRTLPSYREGDFTLADLDGDGGLEVLVGIFSGTLYALRGSDGTILWSDVGGTTQALAPAVVDVTNDGSPEVLYMTERGTSVRVLNATGGFVTAWNVTANGPGWRQLSQQPMTTPAVADLDGDGAMEVVVPTGSGVQAFATGGLSRDWRTFGYNVNHTHRAGDGTSLDGVPFLAVTLGAPAASPAGSASWEYRDGIARWTAPGGDYGPPEGSAATTSGWIPWNVTMMVRDWHTGAYPNVGLVLTEADETSGGLHGFLSSDASDPVLRPRLTIAYTIPVVDPAPRIAMRIPDVTRAEDGPPWSLDLSAYAEDDDTPAVDLRWNVTGLEPSFVQVAGRNVPGNHVLGFTPQRDAFGSRLVTYWLTDPQGNFAAQTAWVNLTPVNDAPTFASPATFVVRYNRTYTFDFDPYMGDVDDPVPSLVLSSDDATHAIVSGHNVSFHYPEWDLGAWKFVGLAVSDGRLSASRVVAVRVSADDPPVVTRPLPDLTLVEGEFRAGVFDLDDYFTDPGNDALYFSYGYSHLNITIRPDHSVDIEAQSNWFGVERVTFRGTDPEGALAEDTILVTVVPVDDPPVLGPVPDLHVHYDADYTFNLDPYIEDPDTELDGINASTSSPYVTVSRHLLTLRYPIALNGTVQPLTIWIGDGTTVVSRTIQVTVSDNWPPVVAAKMGDRSFDEDASLANAYLLTSFFVDPDGMPLFYTSGNAHVLVSIDGVGHVNLSAERDWFGAERITFRATDARGALAEDTVTITVRAVNDAPAFLPIPTVYLNGTAGFVDLLPFLTDVDNNLTDLVLTTTSASARPIGQGLLLQFGGDAVEDIEVVASDGSLTNRTTFRVVVTVPRGPEVVPGYLYWILATVLGAAFGAFPLYRRRRIEWAFLVSNGGLLISSVSRRDPAALDTDLMMGMLTAIMDFTRNSFSDETERGLEELDLGDRRVEIERGARGYLAVVYRGRTPGSLPRLMRSFIAYLEAEYPSAFGDVVEPATLEDIPVQLKRFIDRAWWPFLRFGNAPKR